MRKLILFFVASIILSSCSSIGSKENGRYNIITHEYRGIIVIDTQTGILYYPNPGEKDWLYEDIITTAKKDPEL